MRIRHLSIVRLVAGGPRRVGRRCHDWAPARKFDRQAGALGDRSATSPGYCSRVL